MRITNNCLLLQQARPLWERGRERVSNGRLSDASAFWIGNMVISRFCMKKHRFSASKYFVRYHWIKPFWIESIIWMYITYIPTLSFTQNAKLNDQLDTLMVVTIKTTSYLMYSPRIPILCWLSHWKMNVVYDEFESQIETIIIHRPQCRFILSALHAIDH